ncbi:MAG TPA: DUF4403 family protein [Prolixibacteraceae bacterium]
MKIFFALAKQTWYSCLFFLLIGIIWTGCKTMQPQMPVESYKYVPVRPKTSTVNLQADLEVSRLEEIINNQTDSVLYEDKSFMDKGGDNLKLKASKNGRIRMTFEDDVLYWEIPLKLNIKKTIAFLAITIPIADVLEATGEINLKFKTKLSVNRDWSIKTETTPNDYDWIKKPSLKIAGFTIPIQTLTDALLYLNLENYSKEVDKAISDSFDFRKYAEKGWQMMFEPFKIPGDYKAWLTMTPYSVSLLPVKGSKGFIHFRTAVAADVECLLDKQPLPGKVTAMPTIQPLELPSDSFRINLLTDIPYTTIERMTMEEVGDSVFTFDKRRLKFESFHIYGSNGQMVVETNVKGSINGTMFLTGMPVFNAADTTLRVKNLKFDLKTRNLMTKSGKWIFNGKIERSLTKAIAIPFNTNVREIENQLKGFLSHYRLGYGFEINGKLSRMTVSELILTPESIKANIVFSGNLSLGISEQAMKK